nr:hypothetical protein [Tanacetum cinerariifolium]
MSSASSAVTYTSVYTNFEPGRPVAPPSPDYIPGPEEPQTPPVPQDEDEREPMFIQPHDPDYVPGPMYPEYDAGSDPEEDEDDKSEDGLVDYPLNGGDDDDGDSSRDDGDSSGDDADDEDDDAEEEEEDYLALADSTIASISLPPEAVVERLLAMPNPPPSLLTSLSPPSTGEHLARLASAHALIDAVTTVLPSPLLPLPLYIPPPVVRRDDILETKMPPRKRSYLFALGSMHEIKKSSTARPTGDPAEAVPEITPMTLGEVNTRVTELAKLHEHDTHDVYALLEDAQDSRTRISQRVTTDSQRVDLLMEDRIAHQETILIMKEEAYAAREAPCTSDTVIAAGYSYSDTTPEILRVMGDMRREMGDMQAEFLALREQQRRARQPRLDARVPDHQDAFRDADSYI